MACHGTKLPVNSLKVAILSRTGNVGVEEGGCLLAGKKRNDYISKIESNC